VTPHGDAHVVGTVLRLTAAKTGTRLEVEEGKVRLKGTDVAAGQVAFAAPAPSPSFAGSPACGPTGSWTRARAQSRPTPPAWATTRRSGTRPSGPSESSGAASNAARPVSTSPGSIRARVPSVAFTAACWIRHEELDDWQDVYFSTQGFSIVREGNLERGRIRVMFLSDETSPNLPVNSVVRPGEWMHLALAWDGGSRPALSQRPRGRLEAASPA
jgi:hypothetical protein